MENFVSGWMNAIERFRSGETLEWITHEAAAKVRDGAAYYGRGMVAAVEALNGWLDLARREAKAHGLPEARTDELIRLAQAA